MGTVDDYLETLSEPDRVAIERVYALAQELAPDAVQGVGYGMPALTYRGRPLISVKRTKKHFGLYPFSASVVSAVSAQLVRHVGGKGTITFQAEDPLSGEAIRAIVTARRDEIDGLG